MKEKITSLIQNLKKYWRLAPEGRYMPFREIACLATGSIGVRIITYCVGQMIISVGNSLIGNTIGITPSNIYIIYVIAVISGFPLTALRAYLIDNTRGMKGKYRPYLLTMGLPTALIGTVFVSLPYDSFSQLGKCIAVLICNIGFQFFYNFYCDVNDSLILVLSPNTIERTDVGAVKNIIENISPSVVSILFPLFAKLITGENTIYDMKIYRILYPPILLGGFALSMLEYVNIREKLVTPKKFEVRLSVRDAFREIAHNKYFWIISLAGWLGFLEGSYGKILEWMYNYRKICTAGQYSLITAVIGNASFWPNLIAPIAIRKFGKKNVLLYSNIFNIFFIMIMIPVVRMQSKSAIWIMLVCSFVNGLITSLGHMFGPALQGDIRDYQQYISGRRIDGMFSAVGLIGSVVTLITNSVLPMIYEKSGLNAATAISLGYDGSNVYDVLYDAGYFSHICTVLVVASVIGAALNVIPFFFYDLTEAQQSAMVGVLKIRAWADDKKDGLATAEQEDEALKIIQNAMNTQDGTEESVLIMRELTKYESGFGANALERAEKIISSGLRGFTAAGTYSAADIKNINGKSFTDKELKKQAKIERSKFIASEKTIKKYYKTGLTEYDESTITALYKRREEIEKTVASLYEKLKAGERDDDTKSALKAAKKELAECEKLLKTEGKAYAVYMRAAAPYLDALKTSARAGVYKNIITAK